MSRFWLSVVVVFALVVLATAAWAEEEGAVAPAGCWVLEDGCAARTGRSHTDPVRGPLEEAWHWSEGGPIEGEPRVWLNRVFLAVKAGDDKRSLHVLNLHDGKKAASPRKFKTSLDLAPSVWGGLVVVRAGPAELEALVLRRKKLVRVWRAKGASFGAPVLLGGDVYVQDGDDIVCWRVGGREPRWRASGPFRGKLSVCGPMVYAIRYESGSGQVVQLDRKDGSIKDRKDVGNHGSRTAPARSIRSTVVVASKDLFVQHGVPVRSSGGGASTNWFRRTPTSSGSARLSDGGLYDLKRPPVPTGERFLFLVDDAEMGRTLRHAKLLPDGSGFKSVLLSDAKRHPEIIRATVPYTVAGHTAFVGGMGFDARSLRITWKHPGSLQFRPVPARGHLLVVPEAGRLVAMRPEGAGASEVVWLGVAAAAAPGAAPLEVEGALLLTDWSVYEGAYRLTPGGDTVGILRGKDRVDRIPVSDVHVALDGEGRLLLTRELETAPWAVSTLFHQKQASAYAKLAGDAQRARDATLMARLIREAAARGADDKKVAGLRTRLARLNKKLKGKVNEKSAARVREKVAALEKEASDALQRALVSALDDERWPVRRQVLRLVLSADPKHASAVDLVRTNLPDFLDPPTPFDAIHWLEVIDAVRGVKVDPVEVPKGVRERELTRHQRELGMSRHIWRKDLVGLESEQLMVITPLKTPERVATCISLGELTCRALEAVFADGEHVHTDRYPLILQIFETQKEYETFSERFGTSPGGLEHTAGHFDPGSGVSRIYLPARKEDAFAKVMEVYTHELTHHWLRERCPLYPIAKVRQRPKAPGYWIVEGMATFVEEFDWDLEAKTWRTDHYGAHSLDVVAGAKSGQLLPWARVFDVSHDTFDDLDVKPTREVPMQWRLGWFSNISDVRMFYNQAAATCQYLYHAGDEQRQQLLNYVRDYYTGTLTEEEARGKHLAARFGMSADEMGKAVVAYAKARVFSRGP